MRAEPSETGGAKGAALGWAQRPGRRFSSRALFLLVFVIPESLATAIAYWIVASIFGAKDPFSPLAIAAIAVWPLGGLLFLVRPVEAYFARPMLGLRPPSDAERAALDRCFAEVASRANERPPQYMLRVQESDDLNAVAVGGHLIGVTTRALSLPEERLQAVLAHELGHQDGAHSIALAINWWTTLPWRTMTSIARFHIVFFLISLPVRVVGLLAYVGQASASRAVELEADRFAAELGYAPALAATLSTLPEGPAAGWLARLLATHPPTPARIRALQVAA